MNIAAVSLGALAAAVALSCFSRLNVGLLAIAASWLIGVYLGGMTARQVMAGFPVELFLTLSGVTLVFAQAQVNGTLDRVAHQALRLCRGSVGLVPILYFLVAAGIASMGPGNIATAGLIAPVAMSTAHRMRISPFLMAIMAGNGANSGSLSPIAPTGLIVAGLMEKIGLGGMQIEAWLYNMLAHAIVAFGGYLLLGGWKLLRAGRRHQDEQQARKLEREHWITAGMIVVLLAAVIVLKAHVGLAAFTCAVLLSLLRVASDGEAIRQMPWSTILMVCGVSVLISLMEKTDGMKLFADLLAATATPVTAVPVMGLIVGLISAYSSTSGVVLPAFLPTVPALAAKLGGGDIAALAMTMNIGGHLVDVSPLSTIGALCVASLPAEEEARKLFYQLLAWGLSMVVVGAILCTLMFNN